MSIQTANSIFKQQQGRLVKATHKRGTISSVNISSRTANVYFTENPQTVVRNVPVAAGIDINGVLPGMQCRVDTFDENTPNSMVVSYVLGKAGSNTTAPTPTILIPVGAPSNSGSPGVTGQVSFDTVHFYICIATNTWRRVDISVF